MEIHRESTNEFRVFKVLHTSTHGGYEKLQRQWRLSHTDSNGFVAKVEYKWLDVPVYIAGEDECN